MSRKTFVEELIPARRVQMQMGDHQMLGNQRAYVQKVIPVQPGANGTPNGAFVQGQTVRVVARDGAPPQRVVQIAQVPRQVLQNGAGPHLVRQVHPGQQFQPNYAHGGTIAGRSVAAAGGVPIRNGQPMGQQHGYQRTTMVQQQQGGTTQRAIYVTSSQQMSAQSGQTRYVQAHQPPQQQNVGGAGGNNNGPAQQYHQMHRPPAQNVHVMHPRHPQMRQMPQIAQPTNPAPPQAPQNIQQPQQPPQQPPQQQFYVPRGMNLAVPLREPSPEPVAIKIEEPEVPAQGSSVKNEEPMPDEADIDIQIRNVVCNYTLPLHIDLRKLAMNTHNVTYEREKGVMMKQKRSPNCYIKVYSSGKVYIVGCRSEEDCRRAARSVARHVQRVMGKLNEKVVIRNYRVNNVLATCRLPFGIKIEEVAEKYPAEATYEPELSVGLVWRSTTPKATLRIHTTGSITVTGASSEADVLEVLSKIYPIVLDFRCQERAKGGAAAAQKRKRKAPTSRGPTVKREKLDNTVYGNSGVVNNKVYFSDEEDDLYDDLELED